MRAPERLIGVSPLVLPIPLLGGVITQIAGTWVLATDATCYNNMKYSTDAVGEADGDSFSVPFYCPPGVYTLVVCAKKTNDSGMVDAYIDSVKVASSLDFYLAGVCVQTGVAIGAGKHTLTLTVNGKNALSASYKFLANTVMLKKTA